MNYKEKDIALVDKIKIEGKNYHYTIKTDTLEEIVQIRDGNGSRRGKTVNVYHNSLLWNGRLVKNFA